MPTKQTKINIIFILLLNIIIWSVFVYAFIQIKNGENRMFELENAMRENLRKQKMEMDLSKELSRTQEEREKLLSFFVAKDGEVDFIRKVEDLVSQSNLKSEIKSVEIEQIAGSTVIENIKINLDVVGEWSDILLFQKTLENIPQVIAISGFSFEKFDTYNVKGRLVSQWLGSFEFRVAKIKDI